MSLAELQALQRSNIIGQCRNGVGEQDDLEYEDMDYLDGMIRSEDEYEDFRLPVGVNGADSCTDMQEVANDPKIEEMDYVEIQYMMLDGKELTEDEYEKFTFPEGVEKSDFVFEIVEENGVKTYIIRQVEKLPYEVDGIYQELDGLSLTEDQYIDFCFPDGVYPGDFYVEEIVENGVNLYVIHRKKDNEDEFCADTQTSLF